MRNSLLRAATATSRAARRAGAVMVMGGVMCVAPAATTSDSLCGTAILEDLRLDHDVACTGDGLMAGADGIRIDLNGYTLSGSGTGVGIAITGRHDVSIAGGTIRSFATGLRVVASGNTLSANSCGLKGPTAGNVLKDNVYEGNTVDTCS